MKRYIKASSNKLSKYINYKIGRQEFSVHYDIPEDIDLIKFQMSKIHPYDDAEYVWANVGLAQPLLIQYCKNGKVIEKDYIPSFYEYANDDRVEYMSNETLDEEHYFYCLLEIVGQELRKFNKDIKPKISHW